MPHQVHFLSHLNVNLQISASHLFNKISLIFNDLGETLKKKKLYLYLSPVHLFNSFPYRNPVFSHSDRPMLHILKGLMVTSEKYFIAWCYTLWATTQPEYFHKLLITITLGLIHLVWSHRDQIANIHWIIEKGEISRKTSVSAFIYANAFHCVDHSKRWKILKEMGIPDHLICLLRNCEWRSGSNS